MPLYIHNNYMFGTHHNYMFVNGCLFIYIIPVWFLRFSVCVLGIEPRYSCTQYTRPYSSFFLAVNVDFFCGQCTHILFMDPTNFTFQQLFH